MDTEQYIAGFSGPSFGCSKANTTGEELLRSDAGLSKSDKQLAAKYLAIRKTVSPERFRHVPNQQAPADLGVCDLKKQLLDNASWSWEKDKTAVSFTIVMDAGRPEQSWDVEQPYKMLGPYLKPDAAVLAQ